MSDELDDLGPGEIDTAIIRRYVRGGGILSPGMCLSLLSEIDELRAELFGAPTVHQPTDTRCVVCGIPVQQPTTGRRRKYCEGCAAQLRHRTPATQARKSTAEKA